MNKFNKKGFTLIEMLVVIAIIAILVSIIVPVVSNSTVKAKAAADAANLRSIAASFAVDFLDNSTIDNDYDMPKSELDGTTVAKVFLTDKGEIKAAFGTNGVDYYAAIAKDGKNPPDGTFETIAGTELKKGVTTTVTTPKT